MVFRPWTDPNNPASGVRIFGVLQRIAVCYLLAAVVIFYGKQRGAFLTGLILLLVYWALCIAGNPADPYSLKGWFGTQIDINILGLAHVYKGEGMPFDPEGLMSTIPAVVQVIFGYLAGDYIRRNSKTSTPELAAFEREQSGQPRGLYPMLTGLFVISVGLLITGFCWDTVFPINKKIWTSSYTIYTTGLALLTLATMIYLIEIKNWRGGLTRFFDVFGKNALFVFALSAFLPKTLSLIRLGDGTEESASG